MSSSSELFYSESSSDSEQSISEGSLSFQSYSESEDVLNHGYVGEPEYSRELMTSFVYKSKKFQNPITHEPLIQIGSNFQELLIFTCRIDLYQI